MVHLCIRRVPNAAVPPLIPWEEPRPQDPRAVAFQVSSSEKQGTIEMWLPRELGMGKVGVVRGRKSGYPLVLHYSEFWLLSRPDVESSPSVLVPRRRSHNLEPPLELPVSGEGSSWVGMRGGRRGCGLGLTGAVHSLPGPPPLRGSPALSLLSSVWRWTPWPQLWLLPAGEQF